MTTTTAPITLEPAISVFETHSIQDIYREIREVYLSNRLPWVIGYSGGKDSTTALQLIWYALAELPEERRKKPVYVIASDTLVEAPAIVDSIETSLQRINRAAEQEGLPFQAEKVVPRTTDTFWVNLIGRGYPAPYSNFRWCTDRMKIKPANRFILDRVAEHGEVVMILGVRKSESMTRAQVMNLHRLQGHQHRLSRHSNLPGAYVYTPIEDFTVDDVWTYLLQVPSPWGNNNRDLAALYRSAQSGECPLVIDDTTPSCGNSRFGCWTCTVVDRDLSMEAQIDSGEEWMQPLLEFRDRLQSTQDPAIKPKQRTYKGRDGRVLTRPDGTLIPRGYKLEFCRELLEDLLELQMEIREIGPDPEMVLISEDELQEIRRIWRTERQDWEDSVPVTYEKVTGVQLEWARDDLGAFTAQEYELLDRICERYDIPTDLLAKLLEKERQSHGMSRRASIYRDIDSVLREEWRAPDDVSAAKRAKHEKAKRTAERAA